MRTIPHEHRERETNAMTTHRYRTDLRCQGCVATITPWLGEEPDIASWRAETDSPDKVLTVVGDVPRSRVEELLGRGGYRILGELPAETQAVPAEPAKSALTTYFPILLILVYLLGVVAIIEVNQNSFEAMRAMSHFMGGFFLVFSFFKLLNLAGFAESYAGYDLLAKVWPTWGWLYPFVELALGVAYSLRINPFAVNLVTLVVMILSTAGVLRSLWSRQKIRCACLGSFFELPMSTVTLLEDLLMAGMALAMLLI